MYGLDKRIDRKTMLQGMGNAICPPLAALFIEAAMDLEKEEQG